jgi:Ran GTPase-activating protein (RanGAP) involved in mRNA processing and transport
MKILCVGLRQNKSVTALDLPDNDIGNVGVAELAAALAHNTSLTQLQLAYNHISDEGAKALAEVRLGLFDRTDLAALLFHLAR